MSDNLGGIYAEKGNDKQALYYYHLGLKKAYSQIDYSSSATINLHLAKLMEHSIPLVEIYNLRPPSSGFVIHVLTQSNPLSPFLKVLFLCPNNQLLNYNDIAKPPKQDQPPQGFHVYSRVFV